MSRNGSTKYKSTSYQCSIRICAHVSRRSGALYQWSLRGSLKYETLNNPETGRLASILTGAFTQVETRLPPLDLLQILKGIEVALGRQKSVRNGPRSIDLDILLYDNIVLDHENLSLPHPRLSEREFVLRPLCEYGQLYHYVRVHSDSL